MKNALSDCGFQIMDATISRMNEWAEEKKAKIISYMKGDIHLNIYYPRKMSFEIIVPQCAPFCDRFENYGENINSTL